MNPSSSAKPTGKSSALSLEIVAQTAPIAIVQLDRDENVLLWNPAAERMFGWTQEEVLGRPYPLATEASAEESRRLHEESFREGPSSPVELRREKKDGSHIHVSVACTPVKDETGNVSSILLFITDITAKIHAEHALRQSEKLHRSLFQDSIAFLCTHALDGSLLSLNAAASAALGYPPEEVIGRKLWDFMSQISKEHIGVYVEALQTTGQHTGETEFIASDGSIRVWQYRNVVVRPFEGEPYVVGHAVDITELRSAEERFRHLLESAPDAFVIVDRQGKINMVNLQTEKLFGYKREEMIGKPVDMLIPKRFHERHLEHRNVFFQEPKVRPMGANLELFGLRRDGTEIPVEISLSPMQAGGDDLVSTAIRDISARKRAEELFRTVLEAAPDAMVVADERGTIVMANLEAERLFGYSRVELLGQSVEMLMPEKLRAGHVRQRAEFHGSPSRRDRMGAGEDLMARRKNGTEFPAAINLSPIHTEKGTLVLSAIRDITERQRAEQIVRDRENYIRVLMENNTDVIAILEADGGLRYVSPAHERIVGFKAEERIGTSAFEGMHPDDVGRMRAFLSERVKISGLTPTFEYRTQHADGHWVHVEAIGNNLLDDPVIHGIVVNARDVGERKAAELERERLIAELQEAASKVKTLTGLLPICAACKKIRDDRGAWNHIETYIRDRSDANFTHGICPECARRLYPDDYKK